MAMGENGLGLFLTQLRLSGDYLEKKSSGQGLRLVLQNIDRNQWLSMKKSFLRHMDKVL
jgi:hypothetical protein